MSNVQESKTDTDQQVVDLVDDLARRMRENESVDLDAFDPAYLPETGTPEPGGLDWYQVTGLIRAAAEQHRVVGFDVVELAPRMERSPSAFTAAKLLHKMLTYILKPQPPLHQDY